MKIFKITAYLYLAFAALFTYQAYVKYTNNESYWLMLFCVAVSIFMFFFRMRTIKKMEERKNQQQKNN